MTANQTNDLNPWLTIWVKPKKTIRQIVNANPTQYVILLALLAGVSQTLNQATVKNLGEFAPLSSIIGMSLLAGPVIGLINLYLGAFVLHWVSTQFGGKASVLELRAALAWAALPIIAALLLKIPEIWLFGAQFFSDTLPGIETGFALTNPLFGFAIAEAIFALWAFVLLVQCLTEVSRFAPWLALITTIVPTFINSFVAARVVELLLPFI